jgi:hypothetical protein
VGGKNIKMIGQKRTEGEVEEKGGGRRKEKGEKRAGMHLLYYKTALSKSASNYLINLFPTIFLLTQPLYFLLFALSLLYTPMSNSY